MNSFAALGLSAEIVATLSQLNFTEPTAIQQDAIPKILAGNDLLAISQTGTGKTAAYALPALERLKRYGSMSTSPALHQPRMLILAPTRELAEQIQQHLALFLQNLPLKHIVVYGGTNINNQIKQLKEGVEIVIATVGRLLDLVKQKALQLNKVEIFVLDEADKMLDIGFFDDIRMIFTLLPAKKQTILFSATFSPAIETLANEFLQTPQRIEITPKNSAAATIQQHFLGVNETHKKSLLLALITELNIRQVLIFCNTKLKVEEVTRFLDKNTVTAAALHGDKSQNLRTETLHNFKEEKIPVLVCTDVAARGLDISNLPFVINYDLPEQAEDYIHRIGRTGRAGQSGIALSLVEEINLPQYEKILTLIGRDIALEFISNFDPDWHHHEPPPATVKKPAVQSAFTGFSNPDFGSTAGIRVHARRLNKNLHAKDCALLLADYGKSNKTKV